MGRFVATVVIVIGTLGAAAEILSFAMDNGSLFVQRGRELFEWLTSREPHATNKVRPDPCEPLKDEVIVYKLCKDKQNPDKWMKP